MADGSAKPVKYGAAYSYANAFGPQSTYSDDEDESRHSRLRKFCCCCFATLLVFVLVLGAAALVLYLVFRPRMPSYTVEDVKIQKLNVTSSNTVDSSISFVLKANNPNKGIGIKYKSINTGLWYRGTQLAEDSIPSFYQGTKNVTLITSQLQGSKVQVSSSTASNLKSSIRQNNVPLQSVTKVKVRVRIGKLELPPLWIRVNCDLKLTTSAAQGGLRLANKDCKVTRWRS